MAARGVQQSRAVENATALADFLVAKAAETEEAWREAGGVAPGLAQDVGLGLASIPTGLGALAEQGVEFLGLGGSSPRPGPATQLDQAVHARMSPAGEVVSFLGVPEKAIPAAMVALARPVQGMVRAGRPPREAGLFMPNASTLALQADPLVSGAMRVKPASEVENFTEAAIRQQPQAPSFSPRTLKVSEEGTYDIDELVSFARSLASNVDMADAFTRSNPQEFFRNAHFLSQIGNRTAGNAMGYHLLQQPAMASKLDRYLNYETPIDELQRYVDDDVGMFFIPRSAAGVASANQGSVTPDILIRSGHASPGAAASTLVHETGHAIHRRFDANWSSVDFMLKHVPTETGNKVLAELQRNINVLRPSASEEWRRSPPEQFTEALRHVISNPATARETMPEFTKLIEDFSAHEVLTTQMGNKERLPLQFGAAIAPVFMAQEALKQDKQQGDSQ